MPNASSADLTKQAAWQHLIFGSYSIQEVLKEVADENWQRVRISMLGTSLQHKFDTLTLYMSAEPQSRSRQVRVTNYVYALKRGGLFK